MHISDLMPKNGLYDSHCHLIFREYPIPTEEIVQQARFSNLTTLLNVSTDLKTSEQVQNLSVENDGFIKSFIGVDPQEVIPNPEHFMGLDLTSEDFKQIKQSLKDILDKQKDTIIGIGETGMDFYWIKELDSETQAKSKFLQEKLFILHIEIANDNVLPLTIHSRGAESECLDLMLNNAVNTRGIFHSFTGNYQQAKNIIESGNGLGVNGIFTFKNAQNLREVYRKLVGKVSKDTDPEYFYKKGIFFETDSPFLAPEGKRGEINYPANVADIYKAFVNFLSNN